jgi:Tol biopolymer transport system component
MNSDRWGEVSKLYHAALEREAPERMVFLEHNCRDEEVRKEVQSLLAHELEGDRLLENSPWKHNLRAATSGEFGPALAAGMRLGPYVIVTPIGAGGMGEVYRAQDSKLDREVALKVLPAEFAHDDDRMARFGREARVLASLNHPNIAAIYGLEESDSVRALVMELVEGPALAERIGGRAMPLEEAMLIAKQIVEALEYAHEKGIVHRDLKPANVKLTADGKVKVLDFGLAKALEAPVAAAGNPSMSPTSRQETKAGVILGTPAYMAPEQARGALVDKRADIWAFGVVLYEMLTGRQPFARATISDTLAAVLRTQPDLDLVPARARPLVERCLEKDARRRLRDIGEARLMLEAGGAAAPAPLRKPWWTWVVAGVIAIVGLILWALFWRAAPPVGQPLTRLNVALPAFDGYNVALSPDGRRVVYTGRGTAASLLYTRTFDQEQAAPLAGTEDAIEPFFSPDGQSVGFFAGGKLKKISLQGGGPVALCDAAVPDGASWGEDGNIIAALDGLGPLYRIPSRGGPPEPVTKLKPATREITHRWPQVLPGAQSVLFTANAIVGGFGEATIEVLRLADGQRKTLVHGGYYGRYVPSGHLLYVRAGALYAAPMDVQRLELTGAPVAMVERVGSDPAIGVAQLDFSGNGTLVYVPHRIAKQSLLWMDKGGHTQMLRAELGGEATRQILRSSGRTAWVRLSPDGKRAALEMDVDGNVDVWVYEIQRDILTRLTFDPARDMSPVWSPDGKHIVFASTRHHGWLNLYWMPADGAGTGEAIRLTESDNIQIPYSSSPDGKLLAFDEKSPRPNAISKTSLRTISLKAPENDHPQPQKPEAFLATAFNEKGPRISPDGRWLAYMSDESGNTEVYVHRFPGPGGKWRVSTGGGYDPTWSAKAPELFYWSGDDKMMVAGYQTNGDEFIAGKPVVWAQKSDLAAFDLAPDGKRFLIVQSQEPDQSPAQVIFLFNFFDEMRRRAPAGK